MATRSPSVRSLLRGRFRFRLRASGGLYRLAVMVAFAFVLLAAGGASRTDEDQQTVVRLAAIVAIAASLWPLDITRLKPHRTLGVALAAVLVVALAQLVPLPPAIWAALPGHAPYAAIAGLAGPPYWRPLSLTPDLTGDTLFALLPIVATVLAALLLPGRSRLWLWLAIIAGAQASAVLGILQHQAGGTELHLFRMSNANAAIGLFANQNHQAAFLAAMLPIVVTVAAQLAARGVDPRAAWPVGAITLALLLVGIVLTGSRMGLVLAAIGIFGAVLPYLLGRSPRTRMIAGGSALGGIAFVAVLAVTQGGAIGRLAGLSDDSRRAAFAPLLATARAFLPFGAGLGSFETVYRRFEPASQLSIVYMNAAHDEPLQIAIEAGVPGLILLALFCGWWASAALRIVRTTDRARPFAKPAVWTTAILMLSSLVEYPLRTPLLGGIFVLAATEMWLATRPPVRI